MTTDEAQLVSAVSMLKALGVEEQVDVEVTLKCSAGSWSCVDLTNIVYYYSATPLLW